MIRLGITGVGLIAESYIGLIAAGRVRDVAVTALQSRRMENLERVRDRYGLGDAALYTDYQTMLGSGVDAVLICTPNQLHPSMAMEALRGGKHVLVEKPLGTGMKEVDELVELHGQLPHLRAGVLFNRRASAAYRHIKQQVDGGAIGELLRATWVVTSHFRGDAYYRANAWRGTKEVEGGGLLMTQACHQLDLLQWICGTPQVISAHCRTVGREIDTENEATLSLRFPGGGMGQFIASGHEMPGTNRLELAGTKGQIILEEDCRYTQRLLETDSITFARESGELFAKTPHTTIQREFPREEDAAQHVRTLQNFVDGVRSGEPLLCSLEEGAATLGVVMEAYAKSGHGA